MSDPTGAANTFTTDDSQAGCTKSHAQNGTVNSSCTLSRRMEEAVVGYLWLLAYVELWWLFSVLHGFP